MDRLLQQVLVELGADLLDMAGLFLAQQVAGAADVEVVARQGEAGAEVVHRLHCAQALLRRRGQLLARRQGEIGVGAELGTADPPAELVELGQSIHVRAVHDQGVGGRDIEAGFDDVGADQDVNRAVVEAVHHPLQIRHRHPAMGDLELHFGHVLF